MKIPFQRLLITVLLLGWGFDLLFWKASLGLNVPLFVLLILTGGYAVFRRTELTPARASLFLIGPLVFFSLGTVFRAEPLSRGLGFAATVLFMVLLAETYRGGRWIHYGVMDHLSNGLDLVASVLVRSVEQFWTWRKTPKETAQTVNIPYGAIARGLIIAIPVVGIFTALLTSADPVFYDRVVNIFDLFSFDNFYEYVLRLFLILAVAFGLMGVLIHAGLMSEDKKLFSERDALIPPFLGFIETTIVLTSVVLLFAAFVSVQFQYFFGGVENIGVEGWTYSSYARRGFSELVTVGAISLAMVMGFSTLSKRENELQKRVYSILSIAILVLVIVILISAYQRLTLAIAWHGYSRLRLYPKVFMIWMGILFAVVVALEGLRLERYFLLAFLGTALGFVITLNLVSVDEEIVRYNVQRARVGYHFNAQYLASLSWDALPALVDEYQATTEPDIREGIGAAIVCLGYAESQVDPQDWRSFTFSRWQARRAYDTIEGQLQDFKLNESQRPPRVRTPSEVFIYCPGR